MALVFAGIYWILYISNYDNFVFNADVALKKFKQLQITAKAELLEQARKARVGIVGIDTSSGTSNPDSLREFQLNEIREAFSRALPSIVRQVDSQYSSQRKELKGRIAQAKTHPGQVELFGKRFSLSDSSQMMSYFDSTQSSEIREIRLSFIKSIHQISDTFKPNIPKTITYHQNQLDLVFGTDTLRLSDTSQINAKLFDYLRLAQAEGLLTPWSFIDFIYFSAGSLTGSSYGDIIPNSTSVRMICVLQTVVGYFFIVVLLNVVLMQEPATLVSLRSKHQLRLRLREAKAKHASILGKLRSYFKRRAG